MSKICACDHPDCDGVNHPPFNTKAAPMFEAKKFGASGGVRATQRAESLVRTIQRRYPKATITWREVEDAA